MGPDTPISLVLGSKTDDPSVLSGFSDDELTITDSMGRTALHAAAYKGYVKILVMLLNKVPSLKDERDSTGKTPVHYAAEWNGRCPTLK